MALRSPYEYVTKGYPSLARVEFLLVVIWLLIDTLYDVLPNPQCPGPFSANMCNFSLMISFWIYADDPNEILSKLSFVRHMVLPLFAHTSKFRHILKIAILLVFLFFSFPFTCLFMLIMYSSVFAAFLISSSVTGNLLTVLINTSISSCSCFIAAITVFPTVQCCPGLVLKDHPCVQFSWMYFEVVI